MSEDAKPTTIEHLPSVENQISALASANAPVVFFDAAAAYAHMEGVGSITLTCLRTLSVDGAARSDHIVTAHLRASLPALARLRAAIDSIEAMVAQHNAKLAEDPPGDKPTAH